MNKGKGTAEEVIAVARSVDKIYIHREAWGPFVTTDGGVTGESTVICDEKEVTLQQVENTYRRLAEEHADLFCLPIPEVRDGVKVIVLGPNL